MSARLLAIILFIILAILVALVASRRYSAVAIIGGALAPPGIFGAGVDNSRTEHPVEAAMDEYTHSLGPEDVMGSQLPEDTGAQLLTSRPVDGGTPQPVDGGTPRPVDGGTPRPVDGGTPRRWHEYENWNDLKNDKKADAEYFRQRAQALANPEINWDGVLKEIRPKLTDSCEYIGLINLEKDGKTLKVSSYESSPGSASVPSELVARYLERPALFIFHTHIADSGLSPLPSSRDLSTAIRLSATGRYAASVIISKYGVLLYGLDRDGYMAINKAQNWKLALNNLCHDVTASHDARRSWATYRLADYLDFYPRHRLFIISYPSSEMVADGVRYKYQWDLETPMESLTENEMLAQI